MNTILKYAIYTLVSTISLSAQVQEPSPKPDTYWTYKTINKKELKLSVFLPDNYSTSKETFPAYVVFHGGSWRVGEASWHYRECEYFSQRGMVAVSVDYRLMKRDNVKVPLECVKDAKAAVRYLRNNAEKLKIDPDKVVAAGGSAGGQLAAALGTIKDSSTDHSDDDLSTSAVPQATVLYNPYFKCEDLLNPIKHVTKQTPPVIAFIGRKDPVVNEAAYDLFQNTLKANNVTGYYYVGTEGKHGFCNGRNLKNPYFYWSLNLVDKFLVKQNILEGASKVAPPKGVKIISNLNGAECLSKEKL